MLTLQLVLYLILFVQSFNAQACQCKYGECEQLSGGYTCHCFKGMKGDLCDKVAFPSDDPCLSNPCWNNGKCSSKNREWLCQCSDANFGESCREVSARLCDNNPCQNSGICSAKGDSIACACVNEFYGSRCETKLPLCQRQRPCNEGTCVNDKCVCPDNFAGEFCQLAVSALYTIKIKNKGAYVANAELTYTFKGEAASQRSGTITATTSHLFRYPSGSSNVQITARAVGASKPVFTESIVEEPEVCYDVYGIISSPKYTRISC